MRDVEAEEADDVEAGEDRDGEEEQFGADQEGEGVVAEVCGGDASTQGSARGESMIPVIRRDGEETGGGGAGQRAGSFVRRRKPEQVVQVT